MSGHRALTEHMSRIRPRGCIRSFRRLPVDSAPRARSAPTSTRCPRRTSRPPGARSNRRAGWTWHARVQRAPSTRGGARPARRRREHDGSVDALTRRRNGPRVDSQTWAKFGATTTYPAFTCARGSARMKLWKYWRNPVGEINQRKTAPAATAYAIDLYRAPPSVAWDNWAPDIVERQFFAALDTAASSLVRRLCVPEGLSSFTLKDKQTWAMFMSSLTVRGDALLAKHDLRAEAMAHELVADLKQRFSENVSNGGQPSRALEKFDHVAAAKTEVRTTLVRAIRDGKTISHLTALTWAVVRIDEEFELITGDSPIVVNLGRDEQPTSLLTLSLSPHHLFVMYPSNDSFEGDGFLDLCLCHNLKLVEGSGKFLYSFSPIPEKAKVGHWNLHFRRAIDLHFSVKRP